MKGQKRLFELEKRDTVTIIRVVLRDFDREEDARRLGSELGQWVEKDGQGAQVVVSLEKVMFLNSSALGSLLVFEVKLRRRGGELKVCSLNPEVAEVFRITKLDHLFEVHKTEADALRSLAGR